MVTEAVNSRFKWQEQNPVNWKTTQEFSQHWEIKNINMKREGTTDLEERSE